MRSLFLACFGRRPHPARPPIISPSTPSRTNARARTTILRGAGQLPQRVLHTGGNPNAALTTCSCSTVFMAVPSSRWMISRSPQSATVPDEAEDRHLQFTSYGTTSATPCRYSQQPRQAHVSTCRVSIGYPAEPVRKAPTPPTTASTTAAMAITTATRNHAVCVDLGAPRGAQDRRPIASPRSAPREAPAPAIPRRTLQLRERRGPPPRLKSVVVARPHAQSLHSPAPLAELVAAQDDRAVPELREPGPGCTRSVRSAGSPITWSPSLPKQWALGDSRRAAWLALSVLAVTRPPPPDDHAASTLEAVAVDQVCASATMTMYSATLGSSNSCSNSARIAEKSRLRTQALDHQSVAQLEQADDRLICLAVREEQLRTICLMRASRNFRWVGFAIPLLECFVDAQELVDAGLAEGAATSTGLRAARMVRSKSRRHLVSTLPGSSGGTDAQRGTKGLLVADVVEAIKRLEKILSESPACRSGLSMPRFLQLALRLDSP